MDVSTWKRIVQYGAPTNFNARLAQLSACANRYFVGHPGQKVEGEFATLLQSAKNLADRRNDIVHAVVRPIQWVALRNRRKGNPKQPPFEWCLVPPHFRESEFTKKHLPKYILTSKEIDQFSEYFQALQIAILDFSKALFPVEKIRRGE